MNCKNGQIFWIYLLLGAACVAGRHIQCKHTCRKNVESSEYSSIEDFVDYFFNKWITQSGYECCPGYAGPIDNCQPVCSKDCGANGYCRSPETCDCLEGYQHSEEGFCMPMCLTECGVNAYCKFPERCECLDGYERDAKGVCRQLKDLHLCIKEVEVEYTDLEQLSVKWLKIVDPDLFVPKIKTRLETKKVCCEGYERDNEESPCVLKDPHLCKMEVEVSNEPTELSDWLNLNAFEQLRVEFPTDVLSTRRTEIHEICCDGYGKQSEDELCQPVCEPKCGANSNCAEPNICKCIDNYHIGLNGECVRDLKANDPHVCSRKADKNMLEDEYKLELYCCDGYEQNATSTGCVPKCSEGCGFNCHCVQPDVCECHKDNSSCCGSQLNCPCDAGYVKGKYGVCEPLCSQKCAPHSRCIRPEQCECNEGYLNRNSSCQPICMDPMPEHSSCMRPGEWECDLGYIKLPTADELGYTCQPHCQQSCSTYGRCVKPDVCECLPGYQTLFIAFEKDEFVEACKPIRFADDTITTELPSTEEFPNKYNIDFRSKNK